MCKKLFSSFFISTLLLLSACDVDNSTEFTGPEASILPLSVGNYWVYKLSDQTSDSVGIVTWTVESIILLKELEYYLIRSDGFIGGYQIARHEKNGLFMANYSSNENTIFPVFYKFPVRHDETYRYQFPDSENGINMKAKVETLTINHQDYYCYGYINSDTIVDAPFIYFSESCGMVRHKMYYSTSSGIDTSHYIVLELQDCHIAYSAEDTPSPDN